MLIAQITDMHLQLEGRHAALIRPAQHLQRCVAALNRLDPRPDVVVVTGDLVEAGGVQEYETLRPLLDALAMPYLLIAGNHDDPAQLRTAFSDHEWLQSDSPYLQYVIDTWPLRIIALDTTVRGKGHGKLCEERLAWLSDTLAQAPEQPTVILMHHPPFQTGIRYMDGMGLLEGREGLLEALAPYRNVERILCGHLHRSIFCKFGSTVASTCPGTAHQIVLDLRDQREHLAFNFEPPGFQLHWWGPDGLVTHYQAVGDFPGPYSY